MLSAFLGEADRQCVFFIAMLLSISVVIVYFSDRRVEVFLFPVKSIFGKNQIIEVKKGMEEDKWLAGLFLKC